MTLVVAMVLAGLAALPLSASAQAGEEGEAVETSADEPVPSPEPAGEESDLSLRLRKRTRQQWDPGTYDLSSDEPAPEEPALQLKLDDAGVDVVPSPPRTVDGYTLEEMERCVHRARIGVGVFAVPILFGTVVALGSSFSYLSLQESTPEEAEQNRRATTAR